MIKWSIILIIIILVIGVNMNSSLGSQHHRWSSTEGFNCGYRQPDNVLTLYKNWGNGGVRTGNFPSERRPGGLLRTYNIPPFYPPASVKRPDLTLIDQLICKDYSKRTCFNVLGFDRYENCQTGQYDSCMDGRRRLIWQTTAL